MLSFQYIKERDTIQVHCDHEGMASLLGMLAQLIRDPAHVHLTLMDVLSDKDPFGQPACSEVIIDYSPDYDTEAAD